MRYPVEPRGQTFIKTYGFLSFVKNMGKDMCKIQIKTWKWKIQSKTSWTC